MARQQPAVCAAIAALAGCWPPGRWQAWAARFQKREWTSAPDPCFCIVNQCGNCLTGGKGRENKGRNMPHFKEGGKWRCRNVCKHPVCQTPAPGNHGTRLPQQVLARLGCGLHRRRARPPLLGWLLLLLELGVRSWWLWPPPPLCLQPARLLLQIVLVTPRRLRAAALWVLLACRLRPLSLLRTRRLAASGPKMVGHHCSAACCCRSCRWRLWNAERRICRRLFSFDAAACLLGW